MKEIVQVLTTVLSRRIVSVHRQVFRPDWHNLPSAIRDEESDGYTEFVLDNGSVFYVRPDTESLGVQASLGRMPRLGSSYERIEVTHNEFWRRRVAQRICEILLWSYEQSPSKSTIFALEFRLENSRRFTLEYVPESAFVFDALCVRENSPSSDSVKFHSRRLENRG